MGQSYEVSRSSSFCLGHKDGSKFDAPQVAVTFYSKFKGGLAVVGAAQPNSGNASEVSVLADASRLSVCAKPGAVSATTNLIACVTVSNDASIGAVFSPSKLNDIGGADLILTL